MLVGRGLLGVVAGHLLGLVGRGDECAPELPGMVTAELEAFVLAFDDHNVAHDVAVWVTHDPESGNRVVLYS